MHEKLIKYYLLEHGYITGEYAEFIKENESADEVEYQNFKYQQLMLEEISISNFDFNAWLKAKQLNSFEFQKLLKDIKLIDPSEPIAEITAAKEIGCTSFVTYQNARLIESLAGEHSSKGFTLETSEPEKLLINGVFMKGENHIRQFYKTGTPFVAGFIEGKNAKYDARQLEYFKLLKKTLECLSGNVKTVPTFDQNGVHLLFSSQTDLSDNREPQLVLRNLEVIRSDR